MKNTLEGIKSRKTETAEWISDLEDRMGEITAMEQNKEIRMKRNINSLRALWDNIKRTNRDFPGGPVGKTLHSQCRGPGFDPWSGN